MSSSSIRLVTARRRSRSRRKTHLRAIPSQLLSAVRTATQPRPPGSTRDRWAEIPRQPCSQFPTFRKTFVLRITRMARATSGRSSSIVCPLPDIIRRRRRHRHHLRRRRRLRAPRLRRRAPPRLLRLAHHPHRRLRQRRLQLERCRLPRPGTSTISFFPDNSTRSSRA